MTFAPTRRQLLQLSLAAGIASRAGLAGQAQASAGWSLPIRNTGGLPGDGFVIHHGYACENTVRYPGWWHTAENWHREGATDTAGAEVLAVHAGEVAWIGGDCPGRVILIRHRPDRYSVYSHLDPMVAVGEGDRVAAGQPIGHVLAATGWEAPNHLHFEIRNFFLNPIVNGDMPRHGVNCGYRCPPGPGYWPIDAPQHPSEIGWRNPTHVIEHGLGALASLPDAQVAAGADGWRMALRKEPNFDAPVVEERTLRAGERFRMLGIDAGDPASTETSAFGYRVWYQLKLESGSVGWTEAMVADDLFTGSDNRPASIRPVLLPGSD